MPSTGDRPVINHLVTDKVCLGFGIVVDRHTWSLGLTLHLDGVLAATLAPD